MEISEIVKEVVAEADEASSQHEVFAAETETNSVRVDSTSRISARTQVTRDIGLRVMRGRKLGFSCATGEVDPKLLAADALNAAEFGEEIGFDFPGCSKYPEVRVADTTITQLGYDDLSRLGRTTVQVLSSLGIGSIVTVTKELRNQEIRNSSGLGFGYLKTRLLLNINGWIVKDGVRFGISVLHDSCNGRVSEEELASLVGEQLRLLPNKTLIEPYQGAAILAPECVEGILYPLLSLAGGLHLESKALTLQSKPENVVSNDLFGLSDDATLDWMPRSFPIDDEGVPGQFKRLFKNGSQIGVLSDLKTSCLRRVVPSGNGLRTSLNPPTTKPTNIVVDPGDYSLNEMLRESRSGLVFYNLIDTGLASSPSGDFILSTRLGYLFRNGVQVQSINGGFLRGNICDILSRGILMTKERKTVGSVTSPYLLVNGVRWESRMN